MKISINMKIISGPWGGGNNFYKSFKSYANQNNIEVINHLNEPNIDIILIICNLSSSISASYNVEEAINYSRKKKIPIVQRINECDERKNTKSVNSEIIEISKKVDACVFVSDWLKDKIFQKIDNDKKLSIKNGANKFIFNRKKLNLSRKDKIKIATHHFSNNILKGYNIYKKLDEILEKTEISEKFEFTIIGNHPKNIDFKNTNLKGVMSSEEISNELKKYDLYITASVNEPGGNHVVEALSIGLPILYLNSGSMKEYISNYGIEFKEENLLEKLNYCYENLSSLTKNMENYDYSSEIMCKKYFELFQRLINEKK